MKIYEEFETFSKIVKESKNLTDICRNIGIGTTKGNRDTIKKYILKYDLDISHFKIIKTKKSNCKLCLNEILVENSTYTYTTKLKEKLYTSELKKRICELCGQDEIWNGVKISLILDHINGINNDNRIENLRIVCPNCNAGLETYCGKNIKHVFNIQKNENKCKCGEIIGTKSKNCTMCDFISQRKVERPTIEILLKDIESLGYVRTGKKYGVSDNSIRKWLRFYKKHES